ncbi:asparaginase [Neptunomonas antarctica]|uniref:Asparaginase n=1 Tax=Neptunomonas antarctica TaxID=619304 RepID=A0A1N7NTC4_9GAMM|nr:asparaginase [Neptunomonas antarctica]SIT01635.1 asparaginase [Neptunomonas antarctica]
MSYELFVEVTRGSTVESQHFGAAVVCDFNGNVQESWGDIDQLVFPRSAIKPIQAIGLIESGASDHYALTDAEISLACASHLGQPMHIERVSELLNRLGLDQNQLACGAQLPMDVPSAHALLASGQDCCRVHHNCSGKHTGFMATALHLQQPVEGYHQAAHPVQQLSFDIISDLAQFKLDLHRMAIDGCGFPALSLPLRNLGIAMARFANPAGLSERRGKAIKRIQAAITNEPFYLAGEGAVSSDLIDVTKGAVLAKTGAEGFFMAALPDRGLGIALKIADGNARAHSVALLEILDRIGALSKTEKQKLSAHINPKILNSRGQAVGEIRPALAKSPVQEH